MTPNRLLANSRDSKGATLLEFQRPENLEALWALSFSYLFSFELVGVPLGFPTERFRRAYYGPALQSRCRSFLPEMAHLPCLGAPALNPNWVFRGITFLLATYLNLVLVH